MKNRLLILAASFGLAAVSSVNAAYSWNSVQIWGGGYVPGVTFSPSGSAYLRTDVGGAYKLNSDNSWAPLNDAFTNPDDMGSLAIAVDPENENYVYSTGGLYHDLGQYASSHGSFLRSSDGGVTWEKIPLSAFNVSEVDASMVSANSDKTLALAGNWNGRGMGNRIAVKGNTIYFGTSQNGLLKSTNRGSNWTTISSFDKKSGISAVFLDASGNVYAAPYAGGLYKNINGGSTWSKVSDISGVVYQAAISGNIAWITTNTSEYLDQGKAGNGSVYKYNVSTGAVTKMTMPVNCGFVGVSTTNSGKNAVVSTSGCWDGKGGLFDSDFKPHGYIFYTQNEGSNWSEILKKGTFDKASAPGSANNNPHWISALGLNPKNPDHIIFGTGYGIWSTKNGTATSPTWTFNDKGIEETVPLSLVSSTYGAPLVTALGDIDGSYHVDLNSPKNARHTPNVGTTYVVDFAGQAPNKMIRIHKQASSGLGSYSTDGGKSWTNFSSHPNYVEAGGNYNGEANFAAISAKGTSIVWNMYQKGVYYSKNNGSTWSAASGINDVSSFRVVADRVTDGVFYLYAPNSGKIYKSTDHGATWSAVSSDRPILESYAYGYGRVFASPKAAGDIWVTQGTNSFGIWTGTKAEGVYHSTNGGSSFSKVNGVKFAKSVGFGLGKNGGIAVYVLGIANSDQDIGVYRSDDDGATWQNVTAGKGFGGITMITGDPCIYSRIYVGTNGRGVLYGEEPGSKNTTCKDRTDFAGGSSTTSSSSVASSSSTNSNSSSVSSSSTASSSSVMSSSAISSSDTPTISSSSNETQIDQPTCDALMPECGWTPQDLCNAGMKEYCGTDFSMLQIKKTTFVHQGNLLIAQGSRDSIRLFDLNGNLIRIARATSNNTTMNLAGLRQGMYIAKCNGQTLKIRIK